MLSALRVARARLRREESGYTLIELLVSMIAGLVVLSAAFLMIELSLYLFTQANDRSDSTTVGNDSINVIVQDLQSSCIYPATSPIQSPSSVPSSGTSLTFWSAPGGSSTVSPALHDIQVTGGALTDTKYALTGGTSPSNWTFASTGTTTTIANHVSAVSGTPVFQYFAYNSSTGSVSTSDLIASGNLTAGQAATVLAVTITYSVAPFTTSTTSTQATRQTIESRQVVLRESPLGETSTNLACE
jgi:prepilin-type N-terminal cleavage/methylation domain-containing protein